MAVSLTALASINMSWLNGYKVLCCLRAWGKLTKKLKGNQDLCLQVLALKIL